MAALSDQDEDERWMAEALAEARLARDRAEVPVGAIVVRDGRELARAHNAPIALCDPTAHAELLALRAAAQRAGEYRLPGATLYATLEPCPMCIGAALLARIERLIYGAPDPKHGAAGTVVDLTAVGAFNHRIDVVRGIGEAASAELLRGFFRARR
jgi:tRNA(adenine34) deaminase